MIKMVDILVRRDEYSHEEFVEYWEHEHAPIAESLPGLKRYATSVPTDPERSEYDGIAELYFEDMDALAAAFDSEAGERTKADAAEFIDVEAGPTLYVEETVQLDETADGE